MTWNPSDLQVPIPEFWTPPCPKGRPGPPHLTLSEGAALPRRRARLLPGEA